MKNIKKILVSLLLVLSISFYWEQDILDFFNHITKIEYSANSGDSEGLASSETSLEDDIPSIFTKKSTEIADWGSEKFCSYACTFLSKMYYSIWLPPEIS